MQTEIVVTVDTQYSVDEIVGSLREAGMDVRRVLTRSGIVTGAIEENAVMGLSHVDGVLAIEQEGTKELMQTAP